MPVAVTGVEASGAVGIAVALMRSARARDVDVWARQQVEQLFIRTETELLFVSTTEEDLRAQLAV